MSRSKDNLRLSVLSAGVADPATRPDPDPVAGVPEFDDDEDDPFYYGWRDRREIAPDGSETLRREPLTYADLLSPEVGDFIAESTVHHQVTAGIEDILKHRYAGDPTVAVWSDLKISFRIPGLTTGPGPDVCVVEGVEDRNRERRSFRFGKEPGKVVLTVEVVSHKSAKKDLQDILEIYDRLGVEEYVAIRPLGHYPDGPFELKGWRRDPQSGRLESIRPDREDRLRLRTTDLLVGTGAEGWGIEIWDAATGKRLRSQAEEEAERALQAEERAEQEAQRAEREAQARQEAEERAERAEERAEQEAEARRAAEEEIERLRARLRGA